jgi:hypothetical protein
MPEPAKETVIIVHGTWAAPKPGKFQWYQRPVDRGPAADGFVAKLDAALQERDCLARCWAHCTEANAIFYWSGDNSWIARTRAASALADYVATLGKEGWRCHIVAHSHGGNVLVDALLQIVASARSNGFLGRMVTLGTPFMDTMSPVLRRAERRNRVVRFASWVVFIVIVLSLVILPATLVPVRSLYEYLRAWSVLFQGLFEPEVRNFIIGLFVVLALLGLWFFGLLCTRGKRRESLSATFAEAAQPPAELLIIGSPMDEAWQVLHHVYTIDNPFAVASGLLVYVSSSLRSAALQSAMIARIHGAKSYRDLTGITKLAAIFVHFLLIVMFASNVGPWLGELPLSGAFLGVVGLAIWFVMDLAIWFVIVVALSGIFGAGFFSAALSPLRWVAQRVGSLAGVFPAFTTYTIRKFSWPTLLKMVAGLEAYRFKTPLIEQYPSNISKKFIKYENLPTNVERRALAMRSAWIARHLGDVSQTFSKLAITAADITALLRTVEEDQTLVHAAYYTDDECITRIADWIARRR